MQYHPESIGTPEGMRMIENFVEMEIKWQIKRKLNLISLLTLSCL
jgi:hypothetical protein